MILPLAAALLSLSSIQPSADVKIGTHFTDALAGLAVYLDAKHSVIMNLGWRTQNGRLSVGYKALVDARVHFGDAAPDDSYHRISWTTEGNTLTYEWGVTSPGVAVGVVSCSEPIEIEPRFSTGWSEVNAITLPYSVNSLSVEDLTVQFKTAGGTRLMDASRSWLIRPDSPMQFVMGVGQLGDPARAASVLDKAREKYQKSRVWAEGDWGDFLSPLQNQLGNTKIYGSDTGILAHIVSRGWCLPDGQVLFCWDSFFNGLLSSLEDPKFSRNTLRAILAAATPEGFVPNYAGKGWGVSSDRSQPPVGSYCVWKVHERDPDAAFLKEAYPKLLKWHRWWFSKARKGGVTRDGNGNGLLEWGTTTGDLQNAKFESGLDDSPMFDDGQMVGANMNLDSTDLSALYAFDAEYLAKIAAATGHSADAAQLRTEVKAISARMNRLLWNGELNAYCYRYWQPKQVVENVPLGSVCSAGGNKGLLAEYFQGRDLKGTAVKVQETDVDHDWSQAPLPGFTTKDYSIRWTGTVKVKKSGPYQFQAASDDGCRLWVDGKKLIDSWKIHPLTKIQTPMLAFKAGEKHQIRFEYFQAEGGAAVSLKLMRVAVEKPASVFYPRLSPLNFYPLMVDAPSPVQARKTLDVFFSPKQFGGEYPCPTISKSDPAYPAQGYWRGTVWGPTSYLTFQGLRRYATPKELTDFAGKSVRLFMKNWNEDGSCHENFNSITGWGRSDPHYTWGALLCLLGLEELCDTNADGSVTLNGVSGKHIRVHNLRLAGGLYELSVEPKGATLSRGGKVVARVVGKVGKVWLAR